MHSQNYTSTTPANVHVSHPHFTDNAMKDYH